MNLNIAKSSSVYETFSPLYKALKLFGVIPFTMSLKEGKVTMSWFDGLLMFMFWLLWLYLIVHNFISGNDDSIEWSNERSKIIMYGWHWILLFEIAASFFIQIVNLLKRKSIGRLFRILDEVDSMFSSMYYRQDHSEIKDLTLKIVCGSVLIHLLIVVLTHLAFFTRFMENWEFELQQLASYSYVSLVFAFTCHKFIFVTSSIRTRFKLLNMNLTSFFVSHRMLSFVKLPPQHFPACSRMNFVRKVSLMHDKLNDAVEILNCSLSYEVFSDANQLLPGMVYTAAVTIFTSFCAFRTIYNQETGEIITTLTYLIWASFYLIFLLACIYTADATTKSANETVKILSRIMNESYDEALLEKVSILSQQIKHRTSVVSCGLFNIDWPLAFSMLSTVTTYLFIILQFETSKKPSER